MPALRPFVATLWASSGDARVGAACEHVLPTGQMHLAIRLGDAPLRVFDAGTGTSTSFEHAVVGGARDRYYVKDMTAPSASVGAQLRPGASQALFGVPADVLAHRYVALAALLGDGVATLRERLLQEALPVRRIDLLEAFLATRLPRARGLHPAVAEALALFGHGHAVAAPCNAAATTIATSARCSPARWGSPRNASGACCVSSMCWPPTAATRHCRGPWPHTTPGTATSRTWCATSWH